MKRVSKIRASKNWYRLDTVTHTYYFSYSGGGDREDHSLKPIFKLRWYVYKPSYVEGMNRWIAVRGQPQAKTHDPV
jgi:hypothetical protein